VAEFLVTQGLDVNAPSVFREQPVHLARAAAMPTSSRFSGEGPIPIPRRVRWTLPCLNMPPPARWRALLAKGAAVNGTPSNTGRRHPADPDRGAGRHAEVITALLAQRRGYQQYSSRGDFHRAGNGQSNWPRRYCLSALDKGARFRPAASTFKPRSSPRPPPAPH